MVSAWTRDSPSGGAFPSPLSSLVGRKQEIEAVASLLRDPHIRLVTLTGPGGVGKTRVAIRVANDLRGEFEHGAFFVNLAPISDPSLVLPTIAQVLGVRESANRSSVQALADAIQSREMLLVIDNFEQVLDAAPDLVSLLSHCPALHALVTSRVVLNLSGEYEFPVPPLQLPQTEHPGTAVELAGNEAVMLFVQRAGAVGSDFELNEDNAAEIAEICARLDGLPLAIELAAARVRLLQPHELVSRLERALPILTGGPRDLPTRQQTLRNTIAWSYELLDLHHQSIFQRLSAFVGGFTADAAEAVAGSNVDILTGIGMLVDSNLVRQTFEGDGTSRFQMLETIREFGLDQLAASGEEIAVRRRHASWVTELVETAEAESTEQAALLIDREIGNIRETLNWLYGRNEREAVARIVAAMGQFFHMRGNIRDARIWSERTRPWTDLSDVVYGRCLWSSVFTAGSSGQLDLAWAICLTSERIIRRTKDKPLLARFLYFKAQTAFETGHFSEASQPIDEAIAMFQEIGDRRWLPLALEAKGFLSYLSGDLDTAEPLFHEALELMSAGYHGWSRAGPLTNLARIARDRENIADALRLYKEALQLRLRHGDRVAVISLLRSMGELLRRSGNVQQAAVFFGAAAAQREIVGISIRPLKRSHYSEVICDLRMCLGEQQFERYWQAGWTLTLEQAVTRAMELSLESFSTSASQSRDVHGPLTARELQVLDLLSRDLSTAEIGEALFISQRTVTTHISNILGKLGVGSRAAAVAYGLQQGLIQGSVGESPAT